MSTSPSLIHRGVVSLDLRGASSREGDRFQEISWSGGCRSHLGPAKRTGDADEESPTTAPSAG